MSDWRPGASRAALAARAALFADIRTFFAQREVLEVDTPLLARYGVTDPAIEPLMLRSASRSGEPLFLQTSPEFAMKRLLAAGSGAIYQLGKAFRDAELGARHNPEFTLLEWYRPDFSLDQLITEVAELVSACLGQADASRVSYRELFLEELAIDPWQASASELAALARRHVDVAGLEMDLDGWLDLLMSHVIEPRLASRGLVFVHGYPPSQAALARCTERGQGLEAERFELYLDGVELANGYRELLDPRELTRRAELDNRRRRAAGQDERALDPRLLAAMQHGLPDCSGVALGVDRLLMVRLAAQRLAETMPFDWTRA